MKLKHTHTGTIMHCTLADCVQCTYMYMYTTSKQHILAALSVRSGQYTKHSDDIKSHHHTHRTIHS